ncbi:hypothetical protein ACFLX7_03375 [Chloroflexota bacterium]
MESEPFVSLRRTISELPLLHRFLDDDFIKEQSTCGLKNFLLVHSDNVQALQYLECGLRELSEVEGFERLGARLRGACAWDQYQEVLAQINATIWFRQKDLLKEIEPTLPHRTGSCDALLVFTEQEIYCEVWAAQSFMKIFESKKTKIAGKAADLRKREPWMSQKDAEHEIRNRDIVRNLNQKTKRQMPPGQHGILWIDGAKGWLFHFDVKTIAERIFPSKLQIASVMLWDGERGSQIGEAPFCFVNSGSSFQDTARKLLLHLNRTDQMH